MFMLRPWVSICKDLNLMKVSWVCVTVCLVFRIILHLERLRQRIVNNRCFPETVWAGLVDLCKWYLSGRWAAGQVALAVCNRKPRTCLVYDGFILLAGLWQFLRCTGLLGRHCIPAWWNVVRGTSHQVDLWVCTPLCSNRAWCAMCSCLFQSCVQLFVGGIAVCSHLSVVDAPQRSGLCHGQDNDAWDVSEEWPVVQHEKCCRMWRCTIVLQMCIFHESSVLKVWY